MSRCGARHLLWICRMVKGPSSVLFVAGERRDTRLVGWVAGSGLISFFCASVGVVWLRPVGGLGRFGVGCGGGLVQVGLGFDGVWLGR